LLIAALENAADLRALLLSVLAEEKENFLLEKWAHLGSERERREAVLRDQMDCLLRFTLACPCSRDDGDSIPGDRETLAEALDEVTSLLDLAMDKTGRLFPLSTNPEAEDFVEILAVGCQKFAARLRTYDFGKREHLGWTGYIDPACCLKAFLKDLVAEHRIYLCSPTGVDAVDNAGESEGDRE
jgi:hypothetical protein